MKRAAIGLATLFGICSTPALPDGRSVNVLDDRSVLVGEEEVARASREDTGSPRWRFALGAGGLAAPAYPGADAAFGSFVPLVYARRGAFFAGIGGVGYDVFRNPRWTLTASVSPSRGRKQSDDSRLDGLGNIDSTVRGNVQAELNIRVFQLRASLSSDIAGNDQGTLVRMDALARLPVSTSTLLFGGPGVTWADNRNSRSYFGVTASQSAASGLPGFVAGSGTQGVRLAAGALHRFGDRWLGVAALSATRLRGDAADSPVTEDRRQMLFFAGAAYVFQR